MGNPNDFAAYLIMGLPFCAFVFLTWKRLSIPKVAAVMGRQRL
jgi:hypothetical protein